MTGTREAAHSDRPAAGDPAAVRRPLDVKLMAIGTHGDVLPFVALGRELRARGHHVCILANGYHAELIRREAFEFAEVGSAEVYRQYVDHPDVFHPTRGARLLSGLYEQVTQSVYDYLVEHHVPGRTVTAGPSMTFPARIAQEKLGIPLATINLQPAWFFSADDPPILDTRLAWVKQAPRWCRRASNRFTQWHIERTLGAPIRAFRAKLGLPAWDNFIEWTYSPETVVGLFPEWYAPRRADWPPHFRHAEFPLFDEHESLPHEVEAFLADGPPPVVFTPGSALARATPFIRAAADACRRLNRRGIILSNFGKEIGDLPPGVRQLGYVPLGALLGRCAALVHHGGIGTLSQALRAGIPQVVTPLAYDQPDNAVRLCDMGVARRVNMAGINGRRLAAALDQVLNSADVAAACRRTAALIPKKPSLAVACEAIEGLIPARSEKAT
jgi:UDP:flavonoid glycosyltransferase YjiC (YdhE family)